MKNTIQLIEVGTVDAIPASEVREGDVRLYNYYGTGTVVKIIEKTAKNAWSVLKSAYSVSVK